MQDVKLEDVARLMGAAHAKLGGKEAAVMNVKTGCMVQTVSQNAAVDVREERAARQMAVVRA